MRCGKGTALDTKSNVRLEIGARTGVAIGSVRRAFLVETAHERGATNGTFEACFFVHSECGRIRFVDREDDLVLTRSGDELEAVVQDHLPDPTPAYVGDDAEVDQFDRT